MWVLLDTKIFVSHKYHEMYLHMKSSIYSWVIFKPIEFMTSNGRISQTLGENTFFQKTKQSPIQRCLINLWVQWWRSHASISINWWYWWQALILGRSYNVVPSHQLFGQLDRGSSSKKEQTEQVLGRSTVHVPLVVLST